MIDPCVHAKQVSRRFGSGEAAVIDVSCSIYPGERIALIGPSGSGKSTLLHLLSGLDTPTSGEVSWTALGPRAQLRPRKVANIFQGPSLLPALSVIDNVQFSLLLDGQDESTARTISEDALDRFGLVHLRDKLPEEISGGQAQRVALARAIAATPTIIFADEPTGQLDTATALEAMDTLLEAVSDRNSAIVVSTHDPRIAERFDVVWSIHDGRLHFNDWGSGRNEKSRALTLLAN